MMSLKTWVSHQDDEMQDEMHQDEMHQMNAR